MFRLSKRSLDNLDGVHPDLVAVCHLALELSPIDFIITEGVRNRRRQQELVNSGASQTMNSRHLTGHAIDFVVWSDGKVSWAWPQFYVIADAFKEAAKRLETDIEWGGDWKTFKDGPHIQLSRARYPAGSAAPVVKAAGKPKAKARAKKKTAKSASTHVAALATSTTQTHCEAPQ